MITHKGPDEDTDMTKWVLLYFTLQLQRTCT